MTFSAEATYLAGRLAGRPLPSRAATAAFQTARLRRLVEHAHRRVPYYRRLFDRHGLRPEAVRDLTDLPAIPLSSRSDLQASPPEDLIASTADPERLISRMTTGSSGMPLTIRRSVWEQRILLALRLASMREVGCRPRDRWATVAYLRERSARDRKRMLRTLQRAGFARNLWVDARLPPPSIAAAIVECRPNVLSGLTGALAQVALLASDGGCEIRPRLVVPFAEVLTPLMRAQMREGFGAPVVDLYASYEFNLIARECPATGAYHVSEAGVLVEVLRDGRPVEPGQRGELVATALHSFAMPFLRFRLGDVVTRGPDSCACGRAVSTLSAVQGRMIDYFRLPGGRLLHPYEISTLLLRELEPWVRQYQLTQESEDRVVLRVVPRGELPPDRLARLRERLAELLGPGVACAVSIVPRIDVERSGKFRVSRSLVESAYDAIDWERAT
jgi:phenylacetate-CoA ligase